MPSKRMVPEQEIAELSDEMVRRLALKDAEIAKLTEKLQDERQHHARQFLDSHTAAFDARWWMANRFEKWAANPEAWTPDDDVHMEFRFLRHIAEKLVRESAALTGQRDRVMGPLLLLAANSTGGPVDG